MIRNIFVAIAVCAMATKLCALMINRAERSADTCGIPKSSSVRIVGGLDFPRGSFPWIVALMYTETNPPRYFCGGTLISETFVISAAHCILEKGRTEKFEPEDILAIFGLHDLNNPYESGRIMQSPKDIFIHADWKPNNVSYDADISLLEFWKGNIFFSAYILPICLWNAENEPNVTEGIVTGWGKSGDMTKIHENQPKKITVPIQTNKDCFLDESYLLALSSKRTFCAGLRNGFGICFGDSGSGLFIEVNGIYNLKGIVSSSLIRDDGCDVSKNAVYTNVLKFKEWIEDKTGVALKTSALALRKLFCTFAMKGSNCCGQLNTCSINEAIESVDFVLGSEFDTTVEHFHISDKTAVKFLPREIGDRFPNLKEFVVRGCGITIVRNHYFKNMGKLQYLSFYNNTITSIESDSFKDLVSVKWLVLNNNMIVTLDEKLFATMVNLQGLYLWDNKIKFLSPETFRIPDGKFGQIYLWDNVCINNYYYSRNWQQLEADIRANCTR